MEVGKADKSVEMEIGTQRPNYLKQELANRKIRE